MLDSEADVKALHPDSSCGDSESLIQQDAKLLDMPEKPRNRDTVLSDYLRTLIAEWEKKREQKELAELCGFPSPSTISMVKKGQGVGAKTSAGFARGFGFQSVDAMVDAAYAWRKGLGEDLDRRLADPLFQKGVELVGSAMPSPTEAEVRTIAADFTEPRFDNRDPMWWFNTVGTELKRDRDRGVVAIGEKRRLASEKAAAKRAEEAEWRSGARKKAGFYEASADAVHRQAEAEREVDRAKRRRKIRAV